MRRERARKATARQEDVIVFSAGTSRFAIAASAVDEIRNLDGLSPREFALHAHVKKVQFTLLRDKKDHDSTVFVVNSSLHFGIEDMRPSRVLVLRNQRVAVLVDDIDRMRQIGEVLALPRAFRGIERQWYRGLTVIDGVVVPVIEPSSFLRGADFELLAGDLKKAVAV